MIQDLIKSLQKEYNDAVSVTKGAKDAETLTAIPEALRSFYQDYDSLKLPFGEIYPIETALKESKAEPFASEGWFCFGADFYFSFWLCRYTPEDGKLWFTTWDHESGSEIDGAIYETLMEFLKDMRLEFEDYQKDEV